MFASSSLSTTFEAPYIELIIEANKLYCSVDKPSESFIPAQSVLAYLSLDIGVAVHLIVFVLVI